MGLETSACPLSGYAAWAGRRKPRSGNTELRPTKPKRPQCREPVHLIYCQAFRPQRGL